VGHSRVPDRLGICTFPRCFCTLFLQVIRYKDIAGGGGPLRLACIAGCRCEDAIGSTALCVLAGLLSEFLGPVGEQSERCLPFLLCQVDQQPLAVGRNVIREPDTGEVDAEQALRCANFDFRAIPFDCAGIENVVRIAEEELFGVCRAEMALDSRSRRCFRPGSEEG
jgi:hypothetical protein